MELGAGVAGGGGRCLTLRTLAPHLAHQTRLAPSFLHQNKTLS